VTAVQEVAAPGTPPRDRGPRKALAPVAIVAAGLVLVRLLQLQDVGAIHNVLLVFSGLLVEAIPFILLGAAVSAAIEVFLPDAAFRRFSRAPKPVQVGAAAFGGMLFPVCECGSVPVARRLLLRGLTPAAAVTFMLAAPIVNPVVILSTIFAFQGRDILGLMVGGRIGLGLMVAIIGGLVASRALTATLRGDDAAGTACAHDHHHHGAGSKAARFVGHLGTDFTFMLRFMLIGALVAACIQTLVPQDAIEQVASSAILAIAAMMLLAFALSLCSESDAILISSFTQFSPASQLAFLVFGPMVDTKLVALYGGAFGRRFVQLLVPTVGLATFVGCLWIEALDRTF
jgi:uncharacterized membrane protein YraQ (UPF0718 family)